MKINETSCLKRATLLRNSLCLFYTDWFKGAKKVLGEYQEKVRREEDAKHHQERAKANIALFYHKMFIK